MTAGDFTHGRKGYCMEMEESYPGILVVGLSDGGELVVRLSDGAAIKVEPGTRTLRGVCAGLGGKPNDGNLDQNNMALAREISEGKRV